MDHWEEIRALARQRRMEIRPRACDDSGKSLLAAIEEATGIKPRPVRADDPLLYGSQAAFDPDSQSIWFDETLEPDLVIEYLIHEYAHYWIDGNKSACKEEDLDLESYTDGVPGGVDHLEGYSPVERRELQANVFSQEFLLPVVNIRKWFINESLDAAGIASLIGVRPNLVFHQLALALLVPPDQGSDETIKKTDQQGVYELDPYQKEAASAPSGPLLIEAGPGTGKTRALVGRILHLIQSGAATPESILVLTFSNKAAEEMRGRVAGVLPSQAHHLWMGTFHSFGLELLRKYGSHLGLPPSPKVVDPVAALFLLENMLPVLNLQHYQLLFDPILPLRDILGAISRAKDELADPAEYRSLAQKMRDAAVTEDEIEAAEKALEVAHIYSEYQSRLEQEGLLDYGDLIAKSVQLLKQFPDVQKEVAASYREVLVDEYQDVNRACAYLLMQIAGSGGHLWVVGDVRQSIYRFRGAAPHNMRAFSQDFPGGRTLPLLRNYRSRPAILAVLNHLAPQMLATRGAPFLPWEATRADDGGRVLMEIASDRAAEGKGLANEIARQHTAGIAYKDQAVLCRSHNSLARIAEFLEQENIPIYYLGDLFERQEIRDLLALVSLACEGSGLGLIRVAAFPQYNIPEQDALALLHYSEEKQIPFPRALSLASEIPAISQKSKKSLGLLEAHLQGLCYGNGAWWLLVNYLFVCSDYLRPILQDSSYRGQQRRLAIYQFLEYAAGQNQLTPTEKESKQAFLDNIRRLEILGEEKQLRQLPDAAQAIDAVRLMTVHASKGLEFPVIYLPGLEKGQFPSRRHPQPCPPPPGLAPWMVENEHEEEEECLFFVGLSRARDVLCLSRPLRVGGRSSNPSSALVPLSPALPCSPEGPATWLSDEPEIIPEPESVLPSDPLPAFEKEALDVYIRCPKLYQYQEVMKLRGGDDDTAFLRFHRCLHHVLKWAENESLGGNQIDQVGLLAQLEESWKADGPAGHPFESIYRMNAETMVTNALQNGMFSHRSIPGVPFNIPLEYGVVRFVPDHIELREDGSRIIRRTRTSRINKAEKDDAVYGLYYDVARMPDSGKSAEVQVFSLSTGDIEIIVLSEKMAETRKNRYNVAIRGILLGKYPAHPKEERDCPRCPFYFICVPEKEE
jgi:DNA helicase-2/ATP-dependent DNA helicase PcrA